MLAPNPDLKPIGPWVKGEIVAYIGRQLIERPRYILSNRRWYVVQTEPQQERNIEKELKKTPYGVYLPLAPKKVRTRGEHYQDRFRPMLVGYLFVAFDWINEPWHEISSTRGVLRVFKFDERPVPVGELEMQCVREAEEQARAGGCRKVALLLVPVGALVQVKQGPFAGFFGLVTEVDPAKGKLKVDMDIFGRMVPVEFEGDQVEVVLDRPRGLSPIRRQAVYKTRRVRP